MQSRARGSRTRSGTLHGLCLQVMREGGGESVRVGEGVGTNWTTEPLCIQLGGTGLLVGCTGRERAPTDSANGGMASGVRSADDGRHVDLERQAFSWRGEWA